MFGKVHLMRPQLILMSFVFFGLVFSAIAETSPDQHIKDLLDLKRYQEARVYLADLGAQPAELAILEADIAVQEGDYAKAVDLYRKLVAANPGMLELRRRLVVLLVQDAQFDQAKYQINQVLALETNPQNRTYFESQLENLERYRPWQVFLDFSAIPSTNINDSSYPETFYDFFGVERETPDELLPQDGWKFNLGLGFEYQHILDSNDRILMETTYRGHRYTVDTLDYETLELGMGYQHLFKNASFKIMPYVRRYWADGEYYTLIHPFFGQSYTKLEVRDEDSWSYGFRLNYDKRIDEKWSTNFSLDLSNREYDTVYYDYAVGSEGSLSIGGGYRIHPRHRITGVLLGQFYQEDGPLRYQYDTPVRTGESQENYTGRGIGLGLDSQWGDGWNTGFFFRYVNRIYQDTKQDKYIRNGLYRDDEDNGIYLDIRNDNWAKGGFAPVLRCSYEWLNSTQGDNNRDSLGCGLSFTRSF